MRVMKKTRFLFLGLISLVLLTSCEKNDKIKPMNSNDATKVVKAPLINMEEWPEGENCSLQTFDLIAGQHIYAGSVEAVIADLNEVSTLFVKYKTHGDCKLTEAHLFVGAPDAVIPAGKKGNPKIGHFPYFWDDGGSESEVVFTIPLDVLELGTDDCFKIAAHAVVICDGVEETAWARGSDLVFALKSYTVDEKGEDGPKLVTGQDVPDPERWEERLIYYPLAQALREEIQLVSHADGSLVLGNAFVREDGEDGYELVVTAYEGLIELTWLYVGPASGFATVHSAWEEIPADPVDPGLPVSVWLFQHQILIFANCMYQHPLVLE